MARSFVLSRPGNPFTSAAIWSAHSSQAVCQLLGLPVIARVIMSSGILTSAFAGPAHPPSAGYLNKELDSESRELVSQQINLERLNHNSGNAKSASEGPSAERSHLD